MPLFEYRCGRCETEFEKLVSRADESVSCDACGSAKVEKLFSTFSPSVAASASAPCSAGDCPSSGACAGGGCPFR